MQTKKSQPSDQWIILGSISGIIGFGLPLDGDFLAFETDDRFCLPAVFSACLFEIILLNTLYLQQYLMDLHHTWDIDPVRHYG